MVQIVSSNDTSYIKSTKSLYMVNMMPLVITHIEENLYNVQFLVTYLNSNCSDNKVIINLQILCDNENVIKYNELYIDNLDHKKKEVYESLYKNIDHNYISDLNIGFDNNFYQIEMIDLSNNISYNLNLSKNIFIMIGLFLSDMLTKSIVFLSIFTDPMYNYIQYQVYNVDIANKMYTKIFMYNNMAYYIYKNNNKIYCMEQHCSIIK